MKKVVLSVLVPLLILLIPRQWIPIHGMTIVEHRMLAIFILAVLFWILEPIPIFATSVLVITAQLIMVSDKGLIWLRDNSGAADFGTLMDYKTLIETFASPIIILLLGGFFLAAAATKYRLDMNLARVFLKPFGTSPKWVMMGLMLITAIFSMFMSNTATAALMLAIVMPILQLFKEDDPGRKAFVLAIPFAANIGGIGTPIGTPPNAVAMKYLTGTSSISFTQWLIFAAPFALIMLVITWQLLLTLYKPVEDKIKLSITGTFSKSWKAIVVYSTFGGTILLWLTGDIHGMNTYVVAMVPIVIFVCTKIISSQDLKKINWDILWLLSGGIALGLGLQQTGLSAHMIESLPLEHFPPAIIVLLVTMIALVLSTFISNTATANLLLPLVAALGVGLPSLAAFINDKALIVIVTFSCSLAMGLPISTTTNSMAYATNMIKTKDMLKSGAFVGCIGLLMAYGMAFILQRINFF